MQLKNGRKIGKLKGIADLGASHFKNIYKDPEIANKAEIIKWPGYFP
jgi:hypothetical protein